MSAEKEVPPWRVIFDESVSLQAWARIDELYPLETGGGASPARMDMLGWYLRWTLALVRSPLELLGHPPMNTGHPNIVRYPADDRVPVSCIADVDKKARAIVIIAVHIRRPR